VAAPSAVGAAAVIVVRHRQRLRTAIIRRLGANGPRLAADPAATA
jgi:hypothetical protein